MHLICPCDNSTFSLGPVSLLADSASAGHPHYIGGTWTTFQASDSSPNAFSHNKKINEITLGYASSYSFQNGDNSISYLPLHIRATSPTVSYRVLTLFKWTCC